MLVGSCDGQIILRTSSDVFIFQFGIAFWRVVLREVYIEGPNHVWRALKASILNIGHDLQDYYHGRLWSGRTDSYLQMNRLSLRNNQLKFKTAWKITKRFRGIYRIHPKLIKENRRMSTCNWLDLQILGSQPIMPKISPITHRRRANIIL